MSDGLISITAICGGLLVLGAIAGLSDRRNFRPKWLIAAAVLVLINDAALTRAYRLLPDVIGGDWNWLGKGLALVLTLAVASHPAFGWRR